MNKFRCKNKECVAAHKEDDEDNRLMLIVEEGEVHKFFIKKDGSLEHYDSDGTGQNIHLECQLCGDKYEIIESYGYFEVKQEFVLPFNKSELMDLEIRKIIQ